MPIQAYDAGSFAELSLALELERDFHLRAIRFDFSILELQVLLHNLRDPKVPQRFPGPINCSFRGLLPRFGARADQLNDFVTDLAMTSSFAHPVVPVFPPPS